MYMYVHMYMYVYIYCTIVSVLFNKKYPSLLPLSPPQAMLEDKLRHTDWDATCDAIEEAVTRESYLTWLKENEKRTRSGVKHSASQVTSYAMYTYMYTCVHLSYTLHEHMYNVHIHCFLAYM